MGDTGGEGAIAPLNGAAEYKLSFDDMAVTKRKVIVHFSENTIVPSTGNFYIFN